LRVATDSQNGANKAYRCNRSGYKGVSWNRFHQKYRVQIKKDNRVFHLGYVDDPKDGHAIYCAKALELHGEFAKV